MKKILIILFGVAAFLLQGKAQKVEVDFSKVIVKDFAGFGTQYNQNVYSTFSSVDGITPKNIRELETKVKNLNSQYVRIFFDPKSFPSDPKYSTVPSDFMESFIKTVKLAQDAGAETINITYWYGPTPEKMAEFADLMYELIINRKLTAAREITLQNEPNGEGKKANFPWYQSCYEKLNEELIKRGIRKYIRIVGGDLVSIDQATWFDFLTTRMNNSLDGYSFHAYWDDNDTLKPVTRLTSVADIKNKMSGAEIKPLYITEYGVRGSLKPQGDILKDPGYLTGTKFPISTTTTSALQNALFQINGMNLGFSGFIRWDCYKAKFDNGSQFYSCIGSAKDGYPLYPMYFMTYLFTHTSSPGWQVVKTSSDVNVHNRFVVSAIKDADGKNHTVYAINLEKEKKSYEIAGLIPNKAYHVYSFNSDNKGRLKKEKTVNADASGIIRGSAGMNTLLAISTKKIGIK